MFDPFLLENLLARIETLLVHYHVPLGPDEVQLALRYKLGIPIATQ